MKTKKEILITFSTCDKDVLRLSEKKHLQTATRHFVITNINRGNSLVH